MTAGLVGEPDGVGLGDVVGDADEDGEAVGLTVGEGVGEELGRGAGDDVGVGAGRGEGVGVRVTDGRGDGEAFAQVWRAVSPTT
ncbi:MAG: hypothetical protein JWO12_157 [Frankiales bacterium]|nr:hypothetical protein [Frankiales bacterium]